MSGTLIASTLVAAYNDRDLDQVASLYVPDAKVHPDGWFQPVDVPTWLGAFRTMTTSFPDLTLTAEHVGTGPDLVMLEARLTGTNTGPLFLSDLDRLVLATNAPCLPPTGQSIAMTGTVVLQTAQGLVSTERQYWRQIDSLTQLRLVAVPQRDPGAGSSGTGPTTI